MSVEPLIAVTSRSFSSSPLLRAQLLGTFPNCRFNEEGRRLEGASLEEFLTGAVACIVGVERINGALLDRLPGLRVISKYGVGLDTVDLEELKKRQVVLASKQGTNAQAVAELALTLAMGVLRKLPVALENVTRERWSPVTGRLLHGKTVGLVGVGNIGRALSSLLEPFDCPVLGCDVIEVPESPIKYVSLQELLQTSDVVSIHVPLTEATRGLIGAQQFEMMKRTSVLINTARGPIVDQEALLSALRTGVIAGAGLDVLDEEPPTSWELAHMSNVMVTPHIAGSSEESNMAMGVAAIEGLVANYDRIQECA